MGRESLEFAVDLDNDFLSWIRSGFSSVYGFWWKRLIALSTGGIVLPQTQMKTEPLISLQQLSPS